MLNSLLLNIHQGGHNNCQMTAGAYSSPTVRHKILFWTFQYFLQKHRNVQRLGVSFHCCSISFSKNLFNSAFLFLRCHVTNIIALWAFPCKVPWLSASPAKYWNGIPATCGINFHRCRDIQGLCRHSRVLGCMMGGVFGLPVGLERGSSWPER